MGSENSKNQIRFRFILVPDFIIEDTTLPDGEKLLFGEIVSNSVEKGYCWFSNMYLMEHFHVSERTAKRWVNDLKKKGYITTELIRRKGSAEIDERRIKVNTTKPILAKYMEWFCQKRPQGNANNGIIPDAKNGTVNNTKLNNKDGINLSDGPNVILNQKEYQSLIDEFCENFVLTNIPKYSKWKSTKNAHPKSDFASLKKWLDKEQHKQISRVSSVAESGADVVTDEMLSDLPF